MADERSGVAGDGDLGATAGLRVLVLEDEMLVAMLLEDMIAEFGCVVVGPVASVADALALVESEAIGGALLDLNLSQGGSGYPVADALAERGIPFAFVTGYGREALREPYRDHPVLQKPFQIEALGQMLATLKSAAPR